MKNDCGPTIGFFWDHFMGSGKTTVSCLLVWLPLQRAMPAIVMKTNTGTAHRRQVNKYLHHNSPSSATILRRFWERIPSSSPVLDLLLQIGEVDVNIFVGFVLRSSERGSSQRHWGIRSRNAGPPYHVVAGTSWVLPTLSGAGTREKKPTM